MYFVISASPFKSDLTYVAPIDKRLVDSDINGDDIILLALNNGNHYELYCTVSICCFINVKLEVLLDNNAIKDPWYLIHFELFNKWFNP